MTNEVKPSSWISTIPWIRPILISAVLLIPCFWQRIISGNDLQSHLYNAWLATLIESGSVHGLLIGHQSTNVFVDLLLTWLLRAFGISVAERVTCSVIVLVFFWGAFRFISAVRGRAAYWLTPWLAVFAYGYVFQAGLLNYYLACGIIFWIIAAYWERGIGWWAIAAIPILGIAYLAHPMPVLWLIGIVGYCWVARRVSRRIQVLLFAVSAGMLIAVRLFLESKYLTRWTIDQLTMTTGIDQIFLHGGKYLIPAIMLLILCAILLYQSENRRDTLMGIPAQAYLLTAIAIVAIPTSIRSEMYGAAASLIADRLSLLSAILLLALLGCLSYRRWYLYAGVIGGAIFFGALYSDVSALARGEVKIASLVGALPDGARVVQVVGDRPRVTYAGAGLRVGFVTRAANHVVGICCSRLSANHLISRACLGHCFDYANYEPVTGQFRIRAEPGNPVVMSTFFEVGSIVVRNFEIKASYLPLYGLISCGSDPGNVFIRPLAAGETQKTVVCPTMSADR
jgi:hypothetical protein